MKQPTIHYNNALNVEQHSIAACRPTARGLKTTPWTWKVTCKTCLKILGQKP